MQAAQAESTGGNGAVKEPIPEDKEIAAEDAEQLQAARAAEILKQQRQAITERCGRELQEVLNKHGCILNVEMVIGEQGIRTIRQIVYVGKAQQA